MAEIPVLPRTDLPGVSKNIDITTNITAGTASVVVNGIDITYWIAADPPVVVQHHEGGLPTVTLTLAARHITHTIIP